MNKESIIFIDDFFHCDIPTLKKYLGMIFDKDRDYFVGIALSEHSEKYMSLNNFLHFTKTEFVSFENDRDLWLAVKAWYNCEEFPTKIIFTTNKTVWYR